MLWTRYYTMVISGLLEAGARVVAFDGVPSYADERASAEFNAVVSQHPDKVLLGYYLRERQGTEPIEVMPPEGMLPLLRPGGLGRLNLVHDEDGVCRRMPVLPFPLPGGEGTGMFFAPRLAEMFQGALLDPAKRTFGNVKLPQSADGTLWINYRGQPGRTFPARPFHEVLKDIEHGATDRTEIYRNKVVLIGFAADADQDVVETPLRSLRNVGGQGMRGVEVHAQLLNTLIRADYLWPASYLGQLLAMGLASVSMAWLALRAFSGITQFIGPLLVGLSVVGSYLAFSRFALVVDPLQLSTCLLLSWIGGLALRLWTESKERQYLEELFGRYVAPQVLKVLLNGHHQMIPEERYVTVMYCDINNFSKTCRKKKPVEVTRMLSEHFQEVTNIIFRYEGTILRFIGDQFMVVFGAPTEVTHPEATAVRTAVAIVKGLKEKEVQARSAGIEGFFSVKIGIHAGLLTLTSIGKEKRSDYIAIGETANTAVRVQDQAKTLAESGILISTAVASAVAEFTDIKLRSAGSIPIKGQSEELEVTEVIV